MILDKATQWFLGEDYAKHYLVDHESMIDCFLQRYHPLDLDEIKMKMYSNSPLLSMQMLHDWDTSDETKVEKIKKRIREAKGEVWNVLGRKGSGKTWVCYLLLEWAREVGRECYIACPPMKIPKFVKRVSDPAAAPMDSVVYVSEGAIQYSARTSMVGSQRDAMSILPILRHSGRLVILESQSSKIIDIMLLRMMDGLVLKQEPMYSDERHPLMNVLQILKPKSVHETLFFWGSDFTYLTDTPRPPCWSEEFSCAWYPIQDENDAIRYGLDLLDDQYHPAAIRRILIARSFSRPLEWWYEALGLVQYRELPQPESQKRVEPEIKAVREVKREKKAQKEVLEAFVGEL